MSVTNQNQEIDSLEIVKQPDGSFQMEWDKKDSRWSWLNEMSNEEVKIILQDAIKNSMEELTTKY
jgi:hypothetical protein